MNILNLREIIYAFKRTILAYRTVMQAGCAESDFAAEVDDRLTA